MSGDLGERLVVRLQVKPRGSLRRYLGSVRWMIGGRLRGSDWTLPEIPPVHVLCTVTELSHVGLEERSDLRGERSPHLGHVDPEQFVEIGVEIEGRPRQFRVLVDGPDASTNRHSGSAGRPCRCTGPAADSISPGR